MKMFSKESRPAVFAAFGFAGVAVLVAAVLVGIVFLLFSVVSAAREREEALRTEVAAAVGDRYGARTTIEGMSSLRVAAMRGVDGQYVVLAPGAGSPEGRLRAIVVVTGDEPGARSFAFCPVSDFEGWMSALSTASAGRTTTPEAVCRGGKWGLRAERISQRLETTFDAEGNVSVQMKDYHTNEFQSAGPAFER